MVRKTQLKNQPKRHNQNGWVQNNLSKMALGQVGHGGKKTIWGVFLTKNLGQKGHDFL